MTATIRHSPKAGDFECVVVVDKITHLSKSDDGETTLIHLVSGVVLESQDSMNTIEARMNAAGVDE